MELEAEGTVGQKERGWKSTGENGSGYGTAEFFIHLREEAGEGSGVVAGQGPPDASDLALNSVCLRVGFKGEACSGWSLTVRKAPSTQIMMDKKIINSRPKVAPLLPVAWEYTTARGKEPLLLTTAVRSVIPYKIAMA